MIFQIVGPFANLLTDFSLAGEETFLAKSSLFALALLYFFFAAISFRHVLILNKMVRARGVGALKALSALNFLGALLIFLASAFSLLR